jgi:hypothetical protein
MHATAAATFEDRVGDLSIFAGTRRKQLRHLMRRMTPTTVPAGRVSSPTARPPSRS